MSWLIRRFGPHIHVDGSRERFVWRYRELVLTPFPHLVHVTLTRLGADEAASVERALGRAGAGVVEVGR